MAAWGYRGVLLLVFSTFLVTPSLTEAKVKLRKTVAIAPLDIRDQFEPLFEELRALLENSKQYHVVREIDARTVPPQALFRCLSHTLGQKGEVELTCTRFDPIEESPMTDSPRLTIQKMAHWIDKHLRQEPWAAQVYKKSGEKVYLNAGQISGAEVGLTLHVLKQNGHAIAESKDLSAVLDNSEGLIVITDLYDHYAIANVAIGIAAIGHIAIPRER